MNASLRKGGPHIGLSISHILKHETRDYLTTRIREYDSTLITFDDTWRFRLTPSSDQTVVPLSPPRGSG
jgi:hypothetical protein